MKMIIYKTVFFIIFAAFSIILYTTLSASSSGMTNVTRRTNNIGCYCHFNTPSAGVTVTLEGPSSVRATDTVTFRLTMKGGPLIRGGCDISAQRGDLILSNLETNLQRMVALDLVYELTHIAPKAPSGDSISWTFRYVAPNTPNTKDTLYANGNSVNFDGVPIFDQWNYAANKIISITPLTSIENNGTEVIGYQLLQNYPNPFNPVTNIEFRIPDEGFVNLKIYDAAGKEVAVLLNKKMNSGTHKITFDASHLNSGVYFYKLETEKFSETKKMIVNK